MKSEIEELRDVVEELKDIQARLERIYSDFLRTVKSLMK